MNKAKVIVLSFLIVLAAIFVTQNRNQAPSTSNSTAKSHGRDSSPIIIPPTLSLSICEDEKCTTELSRIDWNVMYPGENKCKNIYMKNTGETDIRVTLCTTNWVLTDSEGAVLPSAYEQYFNLTWNREGTGIKPSEVVNATLSLSISPLIANVTNFSFDIQLMGAATG